MVGVVFAAALSFLVFFVLFSFQLQRRVAQKHRAVGVGGKLHGRPGRIGARRPRSLWRDRHYSQTGCGCRSVQRGRQVMAELVRKFVARQMDVQVDDPNTSGGLPYPAGSMEHDKVHALRHAGQIEAPLCRRNPRDNVIRRGHEARLPNAKRRRPSEDQDVGDADGEGPVDEDPRALEDLEPEY
ncbi:hypothetical protein DFJ73DRAFT_808231, partial [Zopfochytrium polystomum]